MDLFTNRAPNGAQASMLDAITGQMQDTARLIDELPNSRFKSLALTKLEECSMWAKKATVFTFAVETEDAEAAAQGATAPATESGG